jgi:hypothetical protein
MEMQFWRKRHAKLPSSPEKDIRDLLRENLKLLEVDLFMPSDPLLKMNEEERRMYLKKFFDLFKDPFLIDRLKLHINNQARKTLKEAGNSVEDLAGSCNINGIAFILDDIKKLSNMYIKERSKPKEEIDKFAIIPKGDL